MIQQDEQQEGCLLAASDGRRFRCCGRHGHWEAGTGKSAVLWDRLLGLQHCAASGFLQASLFALCEKLLPVYEQHDGPGFSCAPSL